MGERKNGDALGRGEGLDLNPRGQGLGPDKHNIVVALQKIQNRDGCFGAMPTQGVVREHHEMALVRGEQGHHEVAAGHVFLKSLEQAAAHVFQPRERADFLQEFKRTFGLAVSALQLGGRFFQTPV